MKIPENYRKLGLNEKTRKGDYVRSKRHDEEIDTMKQDGQKVSFYTGHDFYRRRHVKKTSVVHHLNSADDVTKQQAKNKAIVSFWYIHKSTNCRTQRLVQLISLDDVYLIGLEIAAGRHGETKYQFKKYLRNKIGDIYLESYGPT
jgi:hypothetical protein